MATASTNVRERSRPMTGEEKKVILASSAGTIFEWYDFYLYGSLAAIIGAQFFTPFPEATRNVFALLAFAAGFIVRPFGALVFGMLGDLIGRKYTFLVTIMIMGLSTFIVGMLPSYYSWGVAAPVILIALRMLQGLALGGEYGGAAVYVAEHAPQNQRGYYTSFIQTTATLGLLLSLVVILAVQGYVNGNYADQPVLDAAGLATFNADGSPAMMKAFNAWGWRIPFLASILLLAISLYIRLQMSESPAFKKMKAEGAASKAPLREAFGNWKNGKIALIALLGLTAGQAVVWYSGQFYALFFMQSVIKVDSFTANVFVAWSLILGTYGFIFFGRLSDRIGRKPIILAGCLIAAITYFPVFNFLAKTANPTLHAAQETEVIVTADPAKCSFQFNPTGTAKFTTSCDIAKALLSRTSVNSTTVDGAPGSIATVSVAGTVIEGYDGAANTKAIADAKAALETAKAAIEPAAATALVDAEKALSTAKAAVDTATKAVAKIADGEDEAAKAAAQTKVAEAEAAVVAGQAALDTARAAVPADALAAYDAAAALVAKESGVKGAFEKGLNDALKAAGYPLVAADNTSIAVANNIFDIFTAQKLTIIAILTYLIVLVTMVYGPIAAALVELYPTRIRYSGLSLPYHIGNGWFGGLLPATAFAISAQTGNIYSGLWYAIIIALMTVVIGAIFVPNGTHKKDIFADDATR
ncbi:MAG: MFS transporter [Tabrizicola sp.]|jgi:MFS family permease|uniref:MFS transporter n=1 Tax=Tabrizicola sp. TaxID=2005166 RepID=UPI001B46A11D|nr:MFS transporter [Tabrizicola sp.]MCC6518104.1 MFS transporter [Tabrizicola sp.]